MGAQARILILHNNNNTAVLPDRCRVCCSPVFVVRISPALSDESIHESPCSLRPTLCISDLE